MKHFDTIRIVLSAALIHCAIANTKAQIKTNNDTLVKARPVVSVWHWGSKTEPMGINFVVKDSLKSSTVLASYIKDNITRVYGGYLRMASTVGENKQLKKWNNSLYNRNIKSIYLLGSPKWIYPEFRKDMLTFILNNYINFNKSAQPQERLWGIHLDIEPHGLPEWNNATLERKRELLELLKDTYKDARNLLIANNMGADEIMADVTFWYDEIAVVGWKSKEDRKNWFDEVSNYLNGITIMNYGNSSFQIISDRARWEIENFKGVVEIGLDSEEIGLTWKSRAEFRDALSKLINVEKVPVAIHRYVYAMKIPGKPLVSGK